jgi:hypothetical protein
VTRETAIMLDCEQDDSIQELNIILCRHRHARDWSVAVGGKLHSHISTDTLDGLIEYEVFVTERALTVQECHEDAISALRQ